MLVSQYWDIPVYFMEIIVKNCKFADNHLQMKKVIYIESLHRPFSQQLKTTKWVCEYIAVTKNKITGANLNLGFYFYLITVLQREYLKEVPSEFNGLPSDSAINNIHEYFKTLNRKQLFEEVPRIVKSRTTALEKQIYSTYKAASYYVNLAKDKFELLDEKNRLTSDGLELLQMKSNFFKLSNSERGFYFKRILQADFHLFITHCLFSKLEKRYNLKKTADFQLEFIDKFLMIRHFNFTSSSLENYNVVRQYWTEILNVTDKNGNIRKKYLSIIDQDGCYKVLFEQITSLFSKYEQENFKTRKSYLINKNKFTEYYKQSVKNNISDLGFVNLYDIKKLMHMSQDKFQIFVSDFYELEKNNINIFFSNTVNSIDRRERFLIRNRPVIKIKIK